jgi:hypothetical protein
LRLADTFEAYIDGLGSVPASLAEIEYTHQSTSSSRELTKMKLLRFGLPGEERPGLLDSDGGIRDLSAHLNDVLPQKRLRRIDAASLPMVEGSPRLGVPVAHDHAEEAGLPIPAEPVIFLRAITSFQRAE